MKRLRLILGDQLHAGHSWLRQRDPHTLYVLMELRSETDYVRHHAQKVLGFFAAMRAFASALQQAGHQVVYLRLGDDNNRQSFAANLDWLIRQYAIEQVEYQQPDEWRVDEVLRRWAAQQTIAVRECDSEHFICPRDAVARQFGQRSPLMENFYRHWRRQTSILMEGDRPAGGRWNYDSDNRQPWRGDPPSPPWPQQQHDLCALWAEIEAAGVATLGQPCAEAFPWPLTRQQARHWLQSFIAERLPWFGQYQDAMSQHSDGLFHSGLSFALNIKLLQPLEVIQAAEQAWRSEPQRYPLAAVEGFIRQILGWREYMRGIYWQTMPDFASRNYLQLSRPLPDWYWTGHTRMACLAHAIGQSLRTGYAHHIQRLMLTGNFALLAGCHPDAVDAWYLGIYVDALQWVQLPNTRGMSQFADGGHVGSKPYVSSGAYIQRMSDHCRGCHYDVRQKTGPRACPFNSLYWHFHQQHRPQLQHNPRLAMTWKTLDRMDAGEREALMQQAEGLLGRVDEL